MSRVVVGQHSHEGLVAWRAAPQGEAADFFSGEIDLGAHEPVTPQGIEQPGMAQDGDLPSRARPADEDDLPGGQHPGAKAPAHGPRGARRRGGCGRRGGPAMGPEQRMEVVT